MAWSYTIRRAANAASNAIWAARNNVGRIGRPLNKAFTLAGKLGKWILAFVEIGGNLGEMAQGAYALKQWYDDIYEGHLTPEELRTQMDAGQAKLNAMVHMIARLNRNFSQAISCDLESEVYMYGGETEYTKNLNLCGEGAPAQINLQNLEDNIAGITTALNFLFKYADTPIAKMLHDNLYVWNAELEVYQPDFRNIAINIGRAADAIEQISENMTANPDYTVVLQEISDRILAQPAGLIELLTDVFQAVPDPGNAHWVLNRICQAIIDYAGGGGGGGGGITAEELQEILEYIFTWVDADDYRWTLPEAILAVLNSLAIYPR